jgi:hypothetical protein
VTRFSPSCFFSSNNPTWAPDSRVKAFLHMASNTRRYLTLKSPILAPAVSMTPRIQLRKLCSRRQRGQWYHWSRLSCFNGTAGAAQSVSFAPLRRHQRYHWHCWCGTSGVIDTADAPTLSTNFANSNPYAKRSVNQGPKWDCLIKKTKVQKPRDTVPLNTAIRGSLLRPAY